MDVDIKPLKQKAIVFPEPLKSLILSEPDILDASDFISKLGTWLKLVKISEKQGVNHNEK